MAVIVPQELRQIKELDLIDMDDLDVATFIELGWEEFLSDVGSIHVNEKVERIDNTRLNTIDGSNTTFYTQHSFGPPSTSNKVARYMGDLNKDQTLDGNDVVIYEKKSDNTYTQITASDVTERGAITLATAPAVGSSVYIEEYMTLPLSWSGTPHRDVKRALRYITAALISGKLEPDDYRSVSFRGTSLVRMPSEFDSYYRKYQEIVQRIGYQGRGSMFKRIEDIVEEPLYEPVSGYTEPRRQ